MTPVARFHMLASLHARARGLIHGLQLLDLALECGLGASAGECAEHWIERETEAGRLRADHAAPTHSQMAFATLGPSAGKNWKRHDRSTSLGWYYSWREYVPADERVRLRTRLGLDLV